eukprot:gene29416-5766_t
MRYAADTEWGSLRDGVAKALQAAEHAKTVATDEAEIAKGQSRQWAVEQVNAATEQTRATAVRLEQEQETVRMLKSRVAELEYGMLELEEGASALSLDRDVLLSDLESQRMTELEEGASALSQDRDVLLSDLESQREQYLELQQTSTGLSLQLADCREQLQSLRRERESRSALLLRLRISLQRQLAVRQQLRGARTTAIRLKALLKGQATQIRGGMLQLSQRAAELETNEQRCEELGARCQRADALMRKMEDRRASLEADKRGLAEKISALEKELSDMERMHDKSKKVEAIRMEAERSTTEQLRAEEAKSKELMKQLEDAEVGLREAHTTATKLLLEASTLKDSEATLKAQLSQLTADCDKKGNTVQDLQKNNGSTRVSDSNGATRGVTAGQQVNRGTLDEHFHAQINGGSNAHDQHLLQQLMSLHTINMELVTTKAALESESAHLRRCALRAEAAVRRALRAEAAVHAMGLNMGHKRRALCAEAAVRRALCAEAAVRRALRAEAAVHAMGLNMGHEHDDDETNSICSMRTHVQDYTPSSSAHGGSAVLEAKEQRINELRLALSAIMEERTALRSKLADAEPDAGLDGVEDEDLGQVRNYKDLQAQLKSAEEAKLKLKEALNSQIVRFEEVRHASTESRHRLAECEDKLKHSSGKAVALEAANKELHMQCQLLQEQLEELLAVRADASTLDEADMTETDFTFAATESGAVPGGASTSNQVSTHDPVHGQSQQSWSQAQEQSQSHDAAMKLKAEVDSYQEQLVTLKHDNSMLSADLEAAIARAFQLESMHAKALYAHQSNVHKVTEDSKRHKQQMMELELQLDEALNKAEQVMELELQLDEAFNKAEASDQINRKRLETLESLQLSLEQAVKRANIAEEELAHQVRVNHNPICIALAHERVHDNPICIALAQEQVNDNPICIALAQEQVNDNPICIALAQVQVNSNPICIAMAQEQVNDNPICIALAQVQVNSNPICIAMAQEQVNDNPICIALAQVQVNSNPICIAMAQEQVNDNPICIALAQVQVNSNPICIAMAQEQVNDNPICIALAQERVNKEMQGNLDIRTHSTSKASTTQAATTNFGYGSSTQHQDILTSLHKELTAVRRQLEAADNRHETVRSALDLKLLQLDQLQVQDMSAALVDAHAQEQQLTSELELQRQSARIAEAESSAHQSSSKELQLRCASSEARLISLNAQLDGVSIQLHAVRNQLEESVEAQAGLQRRIRELQDEQQERFSMALPVSRAMQDEQDVEDRGIRAGKPAPDDRMAMEISRLKRDLVEMEQHAERNRMTTLDAAAKSHRDMWSAKEKELELAIREAEAALANERSSLSHTQEMLASSRAESSKLMEELLMFKSQISSMGQELQSQAEEVVMLRAQQQQLQQELHRAKNNDQGAPPKPFPRVIMDESAAAAMNTDPGAPVPSVSKDDPAKSKSDSMQRSNATMAALVAENRELMRKLVATLAKLKAAQTKLAVVEAENQSTEVEVQHALAKSHFTGTSQIQPPAPRGLKENEIAAIVAERDAYRVAMQRALAEAAAASASAAAHQQSVDPSSPSSPYSKAPSSSVSQAPGWADRLQYQSSMEKLAALEASLTASEHGLQLSAKYAAQLELKLREFEAKLMFIPELKFKEYEAKEKVLESSCSELRLQVSTQVSTAAPARADTQASVNQQETQDLLSSLQSEAPGMEQLHALHGSAFASVNLRADKLTMALDDATQRLHITEARLSEAAHRVESSNACSDEQQKLAEQSLLQSRQESKALQMQLQAKEDQVLSLEAGLKAAGDKAVQAETSLHHIEREMRHLQSELDMTKGQLGVKNSEVQSVTAERLRLEARVREMVAVQQESDMHLNQARQEVAKLQNKHHHCQAELEDLVSRLSTLVSGVRMHIRGADAPPVPDSEVDVSSHICHTIAALCNSIHEKVSNEIRLTESLQTQNAEIDRLTSHLRSREESQSVSSEKVYALEAELRKKTSELESVESEIARQVADYRRLRDRLMQQETDSSKVADDQGRLISKVDDLQTALTQKQQERDALFTKSDAMSTELLQAQRSRAELELQVRDLQERVGIMQKSMMQSTHDSKVAYEASQRAAATLQAKLEKREHAIKELHQILKAWETMRQGKDSQIALLMERCQRLEEECAQHSGAV